MGLILFEMICPMTTSHQRHNYFRDLVEKKLVPEKVQNEFADELALIHDMTHKDPKERIEAIKILEWINEK